MNENLPMLGGRRRHHAPSPRSLSTPRAVLSAGKETGPTGPKTNRQRGPHTRRQAGPEPQADRTAGRRTTKLAGQPAARQATLWAGGREGQTAGKPAATQARTGRKAGPQGQWQAAETKAKMIQRGPPPSQGPEGPPAGTKRSLLLP